VSKVSVSRKSLLGDLLVDRGLISPAQKDEALRISRETSRRLGEILIEMGPVSQEDISKILAEQAGLHFFRLRQGLVDPQIVNILPRDKATMYEVLPLFRIRDKLILAIGDPNKIFVLDTVKKLTGCKIEPVVCPRDDILPMIKKVYGESPEAIEDLIPDFDEGDLEYVSLDMTAEIEDIESAGRSFL
jgi:type IV pilus assembly protein PilB